MVNVPERFRPEIKVAYPEGNKPIFEEWFFKQCDHENYLPVFWTSYWVNNSYGKNQAARNDLQKFISSLDHSKQYFTIVQYDDGPLIPLPPNVKVFAMSGPRVDYPIPLICHPHKYKFSVKNRDIFCSFVGSLTHQVRKDILRILKNKTGYSVTSNHMPTDDFCKVLSRSTFTLCPRGYGQTSFRICEALQYGSIPVYISDDFIIPHNHDFNEYGVLIHAKDISKIQVILSKITKDEIERKQEAGKKIYNEKFSFEGCKQLILNNI